MPKAVWNGKVLAESEDVEVVDGRTYFPPEAVNREFLRDSVHTSVCHWKGEARYYTVVVDGEVSHCAAWYYPDPTPEAERIKGRVAFWKGVTIEA